MRLMLGAILILFSAYTGWIVWEFGYLSVFEVSLREHPSTQVVVDLFVTGFILFLVMIADNRRRGRPLKKVLPFLVLGIFAGSIGGLLYFLINPDLLTGRAESATSARASG